MEDTQNVGGRPVPVVAGRLVGLFERRYSVGSFAVVADLGLGTEFGLRIAAVMTNSFAGCFLLLIIKFNIPVGQDRQPRSGLGFFDQRKGPVSFHVHPLDVTQMKQAARPELSKQ